MRSRCCVRKSAKSAGSLKRMPPTMNITVQRSRWPTNTCPPATPVHQQRAPARAVAPAAQPHVDLLGGVLVEHHAGGGAHGQAGIRVAGGARRGGVADLRHQIERVRLKLVHQLGGRIDVAGAGEGAGAGVRHRRVHLCQVGAGDQARAIVVAGVALEAHKQAVAQEQQHQDGHSANHQRAPRLGFGRCRRTLRRVRAAQRVRVGRPMVGRARRRRRRAGHGGVATRRLRRRAGVVQDCGWLCCRWRAKRCALGRSSSAASVCAAGAATPR